MREEDFWRLTPRQFWALADRKMLQQRHTDLQIAVVAATIANVNRDPRRRPKPYMPYAFSLSGKPVPEKVQTAEEQIAIVRELLS